MPSKKTENLQFRVTPNLKKALKKAAEMDSRSIASLVEKLIKDHLKKVNILLNDD